MNKIVVVSPVDTPDEESWQWGSDIQSVEVYFFDDDKHISFAATVDQSVARQVDREKAYEISGVITGFAYGGELKRTVILVDVAEIKEVELSDKRP